MYQDCNYLIKKYSKISNIMKYWNKKIAGKAEFSALLLQSSVSHVILQKSS